MNSMQTVQLKFKRRLNHKTDYMFESVNPAAICAALNFLKHQPLYQNYKIVVDESYIEENEHNTIPQNIIIDPSDEFDDEIVTEDGKKTNFSDDFDFDYGNDDDIMVLDFNEEEAKNTTIAIAPGQFKKPLAWLKYPNVDELCFPKIFAGKPFNTQDLSYTLE